MRIEKWRNHSIRFIEYNGEWWAILKDICDALELRTDKVASRLDSSCVQRTTISASNNPFRVNRSKGENRRRSMLIVNEVGIYQAIYSSRKPEAKKFKKWNAEVMKKLRGLIGLQSYQAMDMMNSNVQEDIDRILDTIYWDEDKKCVMRSITVAGGDVEQIPF